MARLAWRGRVGLHLLWAAAPHRRCCRHLLRGILRRGGANGLGPSDLAPDFCRGKYVWQLSSLNVIVSSHRRRRGRDGPRSWWAAPYRRCHLQRRGQRRGGSWHRRWRGRAGQWRFRGGEDRLDGRTDAREAHRRTSPKAATMALAWDQPKKAPYARRLPREAWTTVHGSSPAKSTDRSSRKEMLSLYVETTE